MRQVCVWGRQRGEGETENLIHSCFSTFSLSRTHIHIKRTHKKHTHTPSLPPRLPLTPSLSHTQTFTHTAYQRFLSLAVFRQFCNYLLKMGPGFVGPLSLPPFFLSLSLSLSLSVCVCVCVWSLFAHSSADLFVLSPLPSSVCVLCTCALPVCV